MRRWNGWGDDQTEAHLPAPTRQLLEDAVGAARPSVADASLADVCAAVEGALHGALRDEDERVHVFTHRSHVYPTGASVHTTFVFRLAADADATLERWRRLKDVASRAIVGERATISHQHGVGTDHAPYLGAEKGALGVRALERLVTAFDGRELLNPGKLVSRAEGAPAPARSPASAARGGVRA